jgi:DNA uptake protein ComE-like DNA-binding protein/outer membrane murein-binding lipoprotein Lpp
MKSQVAISFVLITVLGLGGCVSGGRYTEAVEQTETLEADLERALAQRDAYEQQVKTLKDLTAKLTQEAQLVKDELQRLEHGRDQERGSLEERNHKLEVQLRALAAATRQMKKEIRRLVKSERRLKASVKRYQKELRPGGASTPAAVKPGAGAKAPGPPATVKAPSAAQPRPAVPRGRATPVNLNTASSNDLVLLLGLSKAQADKVVTNRPYRIKGELVAKDVLPKAIFDTIKDRITVRR